MTEQAAPLGACELEKATRHLPLADQGRVLVEAGFADTPFMLPRRAIASYWGTRRKEIASGAIERGCPLGECIAFENSRGFQTCSHTGIVCEFDSHCRERLTKQQSV